MGKLGDEKEACLSLDSFIAKTKSFTVSRTSDFLFSNEQEKMNILSDCIKEFYKKIKDTFYRKGIPCSFNYLWSIIVNASFDDIDYFLNKVSDIYREKKNMLFSAAFMDFIKHYQFDNVISSDPTYIEKYFLKYTSGIIGDTFCNNLIEENRKNNSDIEDNTLYKLLIDSFDDADSFLSFLFEDVLSDISSYNREKPIGRVLRVSVNE